MYFDQVLIMTPLGNPSLPSPLSPLPAQDLGIWSVKTPEHRSLLLRASQKPGDRARVVQFDTGWWELVTHRVALLVVSLFHLKDAHQE